MLQHSLFSLFWHLLQFWLRLSLSSAKCDGRTGIFWQTAHRWSMKKKKKITSDIHNPIFLMMDISHLMHGQQNHEYLMIQLSVKSEVSFFFTLFFCINKTGKMHNICRKSKYMRYIKVFLLKKISLTNLFFTKIVSNGGFHLYLLDLPSSTQFNSRMTILIELTFWIPVKLL